MNRAWAIFHSEFKTPLGLGLDENEAWESIDLSVSLAQSGHVGMEYQGCYAKQIEWRVLETEPAPDPEETKTS
jgi:hypothetical protein